MNAFQRLSRREQTLVALLFFVALPLGLWFFVAVPLQEARARAVGALAGAQVDHVWVLEQDRQFAGLSGDGSQPTVAPVRIVGLEAALVERAMRGNVVTLEESSDGKIRLQLRGVAFDDLGRFLDHVEQALGYDISDMRITPSSEPGSVDAAAGLTPR